MGVLSKNILYCKTNKTKMRIYTVLHGVAVVVIFVVCDLDKRASGIAVAIALRTKAATRIDNITHKHRCLQLNMYTNITSIEKILTFSFFYF